MKTKRGKVLAERGAEDFLRKKGFSIIKTEFVKNEVELEKVLNDFKFPIVLKISSSKIVHKTKINGVRLNVKNLKQALTHFSELKKIKGFEGVLIQEQIKGKEYLLGLKKTADFGYVIAFGEGGSKVEIKKKVDFRICNVKGFDELTTNASIKNLMKKLCNLNKEGIESLDINPLILTKKGQAIIVDSQIVFE